MHCLRSRACGAARAWTATALPAGVADLRAQLGGLLLDVHELHRHTARCTSKQCSTTKNVLCAGKVVESTRF